MDYAFHLRMTVLMLVQVTSPKYSRYLMELGSNFTPLVLESVL